MDRSEFRILPDQNSEAEVENEVKALALACLPPALKNDADCQEAGSFLTKIKSAEARVHEVFDPQVDAAHKAHKAAVALRQKFLDPLQQRERQFKSLIADYHREQERAARALREEEERKARIEKNRLEAEAKAKMEAGDFAGAKENIRQSMDVQEDTARSLEALRPTPKMAGVAVRKTWRAKVVDPEKVPREYWVIDEKKIAAVVSATKGSLQIPGVEIYEDTVIAGGAR